MANISKKYAKALFDTALDVDQLDVVYDEFSIIDQVVQEETAKLTELDQDPQRDTQQRLQIVTVAFGQANTYLRNMLKVLAENRHLSYTHAIFKEYEILLNEHHNQDYAIVESVYELSEDDLSRIATLIQQRTQLSKVMITNEINPDLIGGIRVKVGTKVMDASLQNDLAQLEKKFTRVK
ncbi:MULTISPECIES: F0F1 ATP synthase subunit delta [Staphylococcus]|uniref:ATP synthase subunit delta n=1 Tax=Staphylococcus hsinchuensis TaxID=3051183 RepID=A0ABZ3ECN6_9STAP|nr:MULTISPECIES: F0F1 ATP synthase subunit delta [unclassified Staphylococcus]